jgi:hypothetical protein
LNMTHSDQAILVIKEVGVSVYAVLHPDHVISKRVGGPCTEPPFPVPYEVVRSRIIPLDFSLRAASVYSTMI